MSVTQYIGARYVPLFAEPLDWDKTKAYEPLTIVYYGGNSYTSRQAVPTDIDITNTDYWALTGNYNAQIEAYRNETKNIQNQLNEYISSYNKTIKSFSTLASAKNNVTVGEVFTTSGFNTPNAGGGTYVVVNDAPNGKDIVDIGNNLSARLVVNGYINIDSIGADPTGEKDCSDIFNYCITNYRSIEGNGTYKCCNVTTTDNTNIRLNNLINPTNNPTLIVSGLYVNISVNSINSSGVCLKIGDSLTARFSINAYKLISTNNCGIYFGGNAGVLDGIVNGFECLGKTNAVVIDNTHYTGQIALYNYRFGITQTGGWLINVIMNEDCTGYSFYNVSFEGNYNGFNFQSSTNAIFEFLNIFSGRFSENSLNYHLFNIPSTLKINGTVYINKAKYSSIFTDSSSVALGSCLRVIGELYDNDYIKWPEIRLSGPKYLLCGSTQLRTNYFTNSNSTMEFNYQVDDAYIYTSTSANLSIFNKHYNMPANSINHIHMTAYENGLQVFVTSTGSTDISAFDI